MGSIKFAVDECASHKHTVSDIGIGKIEEAARYYHIGEGKLRTLIDTHPNEDFYVMNGNRALIKREKFERYLDQATAV